jgi:hypothetical protein
MATHYGKGHIVYGSQTFCGEFSVRKVISRTGISSIVAGGNAKQHSTGYMHEIRLRHDGRIVSGALSTMFKYAGTSIGMTQPIFTDASLVIHDQAAGKTRTYHNAALTSMTPIRLSAKELPFGEMVFMCLHVSSSDIDDANSLFTDASASYSAPTYDPADLLTSSYSCAYGATAPWDAFKTMDGISLGFQLDLVDVMSETRGLVNKLLRGCQVTATLTPDTYGSGPDQDDIDDLLAMQGTGVRTGAALVSSNDLVITGSGGVTVTLNKPGVVEAESHYRFSPRVGAVTFIGSRSVTSGAVTAALTVARS